MADYNAERDRSAKAFAAKFMDAVDLPACYSIHQGKTLTKKITAVLC